MSCPRGCRSPRCFQKPLFTPSTKAQTGHDENITRAQAVELVGEELLRVWSTFRSPSTVRCGVGGGAGILIADTKFEFGLDADKRSVSGTRR